MTEPVTDTATAVEDAFVETLVRHARIELAMRGDDPEYVESLIAAVRGFMSFRGHCGGSWECAIDDLVRLLRHQALTQLGTGDEEWEDRSAESGRPLWQNRRDHTAFSTDGGKTWWFVEPNAVGDPCKDAGESGVAVECDGCRGSGLMFWPDHDPLLHGPLPTGEALPPRPFTSPDDGEPDDTAVSG